MRLAHHGGKLLCAARDDDRIYEWSIDRANGRLTDRRSVIEVAKPVWVESAAR
jgi:6-phosphogluconolactonase (cycloisomerase 2 family)